MQFCVLLLGYSQNEGFENTYFIGEHIARMRILTANEQQAFDEPPLFDHNERKRFLSLPKGLMDIAASLRSSDSQIGFVLMCGYFKATKRFYQPQDFHSRDIAFAAHQLSLATDRGAVGH